MAIDDEVTQSMLEALTAGRTTTPQAQQQAQGILSRYTSGEAFKPEEELLQNLRESAESSRQALVQARC